MIEAIVGYNEMSSDEKNKLLSSGKQILRLYVPNFCSGIPIEAYYFDNIKEVFDFFKEKYNNLKDEYTPVICKEAYFDSKIVCMQSEHDSFVTGFLYNY